jgi:hypothetical protein
MRKIGNKVLPQVERKKEKTKKNKDGTKAYRQTTNGSRRERPSQEIGLAQNE